MIVLTVPLAVIINHFFLHFPADTEYQISQFDLESTSTKNSRVLFISLSHTLTPKKIHKSTYFTPKKIHNTYQSTLSNGIKSHPKSPYGLRFWANNAEQKDTIQSLPLYAVARTLIEDKEHMKDALMSLTK